MLKLSPTMVDALFYLASDANTPWKPSQATIRALEKRGLATGWRLTDAGHQALDEMKREEEVFFDSRIEEKF